MKLDSLSPGSDLPADRGEQVECAGQEECREQDTQQDEGTQREVGQPGHHGLRRTHQGWRQ